MDCAALVASKRPHGKLTAAAQLIEAQTIGERVRHQNPRIGCVYDRIEQIERRQPPAKLRAVEEIEVFRQDCELHLRRLRLPDGAIRCRADDNLRFRRPRAAFNHLDSGADSLQVWDAVDQLLIDRLRFDAVSPQDHWIGGKLASSEDGAALDVFSPIDRRVFTTNAAGAHREIDHAVKAARQSHRKGVWSRVAAAERKKKLLKLADLIETNTLYLAMLARATTALRSAWLTKAERVSAAASFRYYAAAVDGRDKSLHALEKYFDLRPPGSPRRRMVTQT